MYIYVHAYIYEYIATGRRDEAGEGGTRRTSARYLQDPSGPTRWTTSVLSTPNFGVLDTPAAPTSKPRSLILISERWSFFPRP